MVAMAYSDGSAVTFDSVSGTPICSAQFASESLNAIATNRTGSVIAGFRGNLSLEESEILIARCDPGQTRGLPFILSTSSQRPTAVSLSDDGETLYSGHQDGNVFAWRVQDPQSAATRVSRSSSPVTVLRYSSWDDAILAGHISGQILLVPHSQRGHYLLPRQVGMQLSYVTDLALSPNGGILAALDLENRLVLWDVPTGRRIHMFREMVDHEAKIAFSASGDELRAVVKGSLRRWNMEPETWVALACALANRPLRESELLRYPGLSTGIEAYPH